VNQHEAKVGRNRQPIEVERLDRANEKNPAKERGREVIDVSAGEPLFRDERRAKQLRSIEWIPKQRVRRDRSRNGGRSTATLTTGERQALLDAKRHAELLHACTPENLARRDCRRVSIRLGRKVRMTRIDDVHARTIGAARLDRVAWPSDRAAQDVQPRTEIANPARCKRPDGGH
jgi:hypothetical protein